MDNIINVKAVKAANGYFIYGIKANYLVDGVSPKKTFDKDWYLVEDIPKRITYLQSRPNINFRYVLLDEAPGKDVLPKVMPRDEVTEKSDYGECTWKEEFKHLSSLYELVYDKQEPEEIEVIFTFDVILEIDKIIGDKKFKYTVLRDRAPFSREERSMEVGSEILKRQLIDTLLFPTIVEEHIPCKLSREDAYKIIRHHVLKNIDPKVSKVTSDYDFCFSVEKEISLQKPLLKRKEILTANLKSFKNKRYREYYITTRSIKIYDIAPKPYNSYKLAPEFFANSEEELKEMVDNYLSELMLEINTPLTDCPHCNGMGVIVKQEN